MWQFTIHYRKPDDPDAFEKRYREVHVPLTWYFPKMKRMTLAKPLPSDEGPSDIWLISTMYWEDEESLRAALKSEARQIAYEDLTDSGLRKWQIARYISKIEDV